MKFQERVQPPKGKAERQERLEKRRVEGEAAMVDLKKEQEAFKANFERLKADRAARESGNGR